MQVIINKAGDAKNNHKVKVIVKLPSSEKIGLMYRYENATQKMLKQELDFTKKMLDSLKPNEHTAIAKWQLREEVIQEYLTKRIREKG